jgi:glycosyltransferase involved in cell wall biosynthesis
MFVIRGENMKKIYFLIGSLSNGGAERVVSNLSVALSGKEYEVNIIIFGKQSEKQYGAKGNIIKIDDAVPKNFFSKIATFAKRVYKIRKINSKEENLVISFLEYPNLLNIFSNKKNNAIISVRNHMSTKHAKGVKALLWKFTFRYLYSKAKKIIAVSEEIRIDMHKNYNIPIDKIDVIYNSYPIDEIIELGNERLTKIEEEMFSEKVIITSGRLSQQKSQKDILFIFNEMIKLNKKSNEKIKLVILGQGVERQNLENLAIDLGIAKNVHF